jgi:hypothetical protein
MKRNIVKDIKIPCLFLMQFNLPCNNVAECASPYTVFWSLPRQVDRA